MKYFFLLLFCAAICSCNKETSDHFLPNVELQINDTTWSATVKSSASVNELPFILTGAVSTVSFQYSNTSLTYVTLNDSLRMIVPANALNANTTSAIEAKISMYKNRGGAVANAKPSTNYNRLLELSAAFNISLKQNGAEVKLNPGEKIALIYKNQYSSNPLSVMYDTAVTSNYNTWREAADFTSVTSILGGATDSLLSKKTGWVMSGFLMDTAGLARTKIYATLPANFTNKNTAVYAVFKDKNMVLRLTGDAANHLFYSSLVPENRTIKLVAISKIDNDLYYAEKEITITTNIYTSLNPQIKTAGDIKSMLQLLY